MYVDKIKLYNFRNYKLQEIKLSKNVNIIHGANAQGKTNILEAIFIASTGYSSRAMDIKECISWNERTSACEVSVRSSGINNIIRYQLSKEQTKQFTINKHSCRASELSEYFNIVMFCPEDLWMIKGPPKNRRAFLDQEIAQANRNYAKNINKFNKVLQQRNGLLKSINMHKSSIDLLSEWDEQFAVLGEAIVNKRIEAIKRLNMLANLAQRRLTGEKENLAISYNVSGIAEGLFPDKDWYLTNLKRTRSEDVARMTTSIGPQRDDFSLLINGYDAKNYASQGQQRSAVLALKFAEIEYIRSETGNYPVVLLDDVMSELDCDRQAQLINNLAGKAQTLVTSTDKLICGVSDASYIQIIAGSVNTL